MLEVRNISSGYGKKQVLFDVSFEIRAGEVVLLSGGNGSGKSTILKCIYNILPCWSGEILFEGEKISGLKPSDLIARGIVYIPQKDFYFENLTVEENLVISGNILSKKKLKERIEQVYAYTGLKLFKNKKPFYLSGGERKILAFGISLIHKPKLLLFDEPLAGLDNRYTENIKNLIAFLNFKDQVTFLNIEHKNNLDGIVNREIVVSLGTVLNQPISSLNQ